MSRCSLRRCLPLLRAPLLLAALILGSPSARSAEAGWTGEIRDGTTTTARPLQAVGLKDGGYLVEALDPASDSWVLRFDASDQLRQVRSTRLDGDFSRFAESPAGHLVQIAKNHELNTQLPAARRHHCYLRRNLLEGLDLRSQFSGFWPESDATGGYYGFQTDLLEHRLLRVGSDCSAQTIFREVRPLDSVGRLWKQVAPLKRGGGVYLLSTDPESDGGAPPVLALIRDGHAAWTRELRHIVGAYNPFATVIGLTGNDDVVLTLRDYIANTAKVVAVGSDGSLRWSYVIAPVDSPSYAIQHSFGTLVAMENVNTGSRFAALDRNGRELWITAPVASSYHDVPLPSLLEGADPLLRLTRFPYSSSHPSTVARATVTGLEILSAPDSNRPVIAELRDGSQLTFVLDSQYRVEGLEHIGTGRPAHPIDVRIPTPHWIAGVSLDQGGVFVATQATSDRPDLAHFDISGALRWKVRLPAVRRPPDTPWVRAPQRIVANAERVCVWRFAEGFGNYGLITTAAIACVRRQDGSPIYGWIDAAANDYPDLASLRLTDAGELSAITVGCHDQPSFQPGGTACINRAFWHRFPADGNSATHTTLGEVSGYGGDITGAQSRDGRLLALGDYSRSGNTTIRLLDEQGQERWKTTATGYHKILTVADDGALLTHVPDGVSAFGPGGQPRWSVAFNEHLPEPTVVAVVVPGGDYVVVATSLYGDATLRLRLNAADGSARWRQRASPTIYADRLDLTDDGSHVVVSQHFRTYRIASLRVEDGAPVAGLAGLDFREHFQARSRFALRADGASVLAIERPESGTVEVRYVPPQALVGRAEQAIGPALLGAWYAADTPGQGVFLDVDASRESIYGGLFSYTREGGNDPAQQRWYSLSGRIDAGERSRGSATMDVFASSGGAFASGQPAPATQRIGTARLQAQSCDRALLALDLDSELVRGQFAIPLTRATPRSRACEPDDAGMGPAAAPARGLDPRSSGAWYDPAATGQGLAFELHPPSANDHGLFAGAWFTYNLTGTGNDPIAQQWFSMAGSLRDAGNGTLTVPVFRSIGGAFDALSTTNTWRVGTVTLTFTACDRARLDYAFDDSEVAHAFARQRGTVSIERIGGCGD